MKKYSCKKCSQNHRRFEMGKEVIWSITLHQARSPRTCCPGSRWDGFWISPRMDTPPLWTTCASAWSVSQQKKKCFLMLRRNLLCLICAFTSCPVAMHHFQSLILFFASSLQVSVTFSLSFLISRLKNLSSQSCLAWEMLWSLHHHPGPSLDSLQ